MKLWGLYAAQKQKFKMVSSEARMKTAWLITMRIIVPCVVDLAMTQTHERHTDLKSDFPIIFNCLVRSLRDKQFANCSIALQDFDIDYDDKCYIALEVASKVALKLFAHKGDMVEERLRPTAALIKAYNFFLSDIDNIVQSIFSTIFENLPAQIQYHPFRECNTLSQFYERYFSELDIGKFSYIASYLVPVVTFAIFNENHRSLSVYLLVLCLWPTAKQWKIAHSDGNSIPGIMLFDELFFSILIKLIEI